MTARHRRTSAALTGVCLALLAVLGTTLAGQPVGAAAAVGLDATGGASNADVPRAVTMPSTATPAVRPAAFVAASSLTAVIRSGPHPAKGKGKVVYLTFDDGPSPYTAAVLTLLKGYHAHATFFVIGAQVSKRSWAVRRAVREGNLVEDHTWNHPDLARLSRAGNVYQQGRTQRSIRAAGVPTPVCMRPPYGSYNGTVRSVADSLHMRVVMWGIDARDWSRPGVATIVHRVTAGGRNGTIVLLHDGGGNRSQTVAALRYILRVMARQGYRFETLPACR